LFRVLKRHILATAGEDGAERDADGHGDDLGGDEHGAERDVAHGGALRDVDVKIVRFVF